MVSIFYLYPLITSTCQGLITPTCQALTGWCDQWWNSSKFEL